MMNDQWRARYWAGLRSHRHSPLTLHLRRRLARIAAQHMEVEPWLPILNAILLVETFERPPYARGLERLLQVLGRYKTTTGPLQLRGAPWSLEGAVRRAVCVLDEAGPAPSAPSQAILLLEDVARAWNGGTDRERGALLRYADALAYALALDGDDCSRTPRPTLIERKAALVDKEFK